MLRIKGIFTYHPIVPFYEARRTHAVLFSRRSHVLLCAKSSARTFPAFRGFLGRKGRAALPARQCSGMPAEERRRLGLGGSIRASAWLRPEEERRRAEEGVFRNVAEETGARRLRLRDQLGDQANRKEHQHNKHNGAHDGASLLRELR